MTREDIINNYIIPACERTWNEKICAEIRQALKQESCEDAISRKDTRTIHTDGLEEGIRCAMCTNMMANNRGCDGGCVVNESIYKKVLDVIKERMLEQQPCEDTISRRAVIDTTICEGISCDECSFNTLEDGDPGCLLQDRITKLPPVTPQPKTGRWIRELIRNEKGGCIGAKMICSECGNDNKHDEYMNYCPNCGKKMDERRKARIRNDT